MVYNILKDIGRQEDIEECVSDVFAFAVIAIVDTLKEIDQQIFYKRYFFYESIEEIAQNLGLTRKAVDNRLWRMRKLLKEKSDRGDFGEGI